MSLNVKITLLILTILLGRFSALQAGVAVTNGLSHEVKLAPGEKSRGKIELQNSSAKATSVKIYQTDYWFSCTGESRYDEPGNNPRSNVTWITTGATFLTLQPNETRSVDFEIAVPAGDTLKGTYWSVIMVEGMAPPDTASARRGLNISAVTRYAVQIITHIGESGISDLQFLKLELLKKEGNAALQVDMANPGERALRPALELELFDSAGVSLGKIKADRKRIYPGTSSRFLLNLQGIKPGSYTGVLVADCDEDHIYGTQVTVEL